MISMFDPEEEAIRATWSLGDYTGEDCEKCGRNRVCKCPNGMTRCEKCNWVPATQEYVVFH